LGKVVSERDKKTRKDDLFAHPQHSATQLVQTVPAALKLNRRYHCISPGFLGATNCNLLAVEGLEDDRSLVVAPEIDQNGWEFSSERVVFGSVNNSRYLWEIYTKLTLTTVEELLSRFYGIETATIVNNESHEIIRMSIQFDAIARKDVNFYPEDLRAVVDETIDAIYQPINNGVPSGICYYPAGL